MGRQGAGGAGRSMQRAQSRGSLSASFEALAGYFPCMNSLEEDAGMNNTDGSDPEVQSERRSAVNYWPLYWCAAQPLPRRPLAVYSMTSYRTPAAALLRRNVFPVYEQMRKLRQGELTDLLGSQSAFELKPSPVQTVRSTPELSWVYCPEMIGHGHGSCCEPCGGVTTKPVLWLC